MMCQHQQLKQNQSPPSLGIQWRRDFIFSLNPLKEKTNGTRHNTRTHTHIATSLSYLSSGFFLKSTCFFLVCFFFFFLISLLNFFPPTFKKYKLYENTRWKIVEQHNITISFFFFTSSKFISLKKCVKPK